jgi:uncharacterized protein
VNVNVTVKVLARITQAFALALAFLLWASLAVAAYVPPPIQGPVTDPSHILSDSERAQINTRLREIKASTFREITVFLPVSLDDYTVEDVSYQTARAWGLAEKKEDLGALLVIATKERKIRIETAKGSGGGLTDLETNAIIRETIAPLMKQGRVGAAVLAGIDGMALAMSKDAVVKPEARPLTKGDIAGGLIFLAIVLLCILLFMFIIVRVIWAVLSGGGNRSRSNGFYVSNGFGSDSSSSSGSSSWFDSSSSGSSSSGSDGNWGGGGGDWGGGGSSGDY